MVVLIEQFLDAQQIQIARQPVIKVADPKDLIVVLDGFARESGGKDQSVANVEVILITSLHFFYVSCQVRIDEAKRRIVQVESDRHAALLNL